MAHSRAVTSLLLSLLLVTLVAPGVGAQQGGEDGRTTVPVEAYAKWERLGASQLSPNGLWLTAQISRIDEDGELQIRRIADPDSVIVVPNGSGAVFSEDGRRLLYRIQLGEEERERLQDRDQPVRAALGVLDLTSGEQTRIESVNSFALSPDGRYVVLRQYPPEGRREANGVDIVVHDFETGARVPFGNISDFAWQDEGQLLAMLVDAEGMAGNGIMTWDPSTGRIRPIHTAETRFSRLTWRDDSADLAVMAQLATDTEGEDQWADTVQVVHVFRDVTQDQPAHLQLDGAMAGLPAEYGVAGWGGLTWSEDGSMMQVELRERIAESACEDEAEEETSEEEGEGDSSECEAEDTEDPTVEIWHAADVDIVPTQKVTAGRDRRATEMALWHLDAQRIVKLEDELTESVTLMEGWEMAVGTDGTPWDEDRMFGPVYRDVYMIDAATGEKERVLERKEFFFGASTGGQYLFWFEDDHYWTHDIASGEVVNITANVDAVFTNVEDDHTVEQKPPFRFAGWTEGDEAVLLYDEHDIWSVSPDGSGGERVTRGAEENLTHRYLRIDPDADFFTGPQPIDPDAEVHFTLYDDWEEAWGYGRADRLGGEVEVLAYAEARITGLDRARDADVFMWRVEDFEDSPDVFVGDGELNGRQITRTNPFQDDYLWGTSELVEYVNEWGDTLQGSLYYPADFQPGRKYPMITYIYEIRSNTVRSYQVPSETDYYNFQNWVQNGYFVFQPDIVYQDRDPGVSAVVNIVPAVEAVVARGDVDPDAIGLIGHSWGGYQTTFFVTQSDLFAAGVAGAPLTNMFSMYLSVYWNSGGTDARIFEISQGRLEVPFWEDEAAYQRNSPVFHIENMKTPLLMAQGTEDGAVDFNQGVEFYNAARRAGKDFVFLVYNDENHGFTREPNRRDYHRRINEWFAHYLKGEPAPSWMTNGVPYLEQPGGRR